MRDLDETDLKILSLLADDARRPYSEIAEEVGLSGPAVSDRVQRLRDAGVIERFTVDVDRSQLQSGAPVFVQVDVPSRDVTPLRSHLAGAETVEHVFVTADGDVWFHGRARSRNVRAWVESLVSDVDATDYRVTLLDDVAWTPTLEGTEFALTCAECGNTVDSEGESVRIDGDLYHFCCPSCRDQFTDRYERLEEGA